mgnify:CR=1 FL=1
MSGMAMATISMIVRIALELLAVCVVVGSDKIENEIKTVFVLAFVVMLAAASVTIFGPHSWLIGKVIAVNAGTALLVYAVVKLVRDL